MDERQQAGEVSALQGLSLEAIETSQGNVNEAAAEAMALPPALESCSLGQRVQWARNQRGLSIEQLATQAHLESAFVQDVEAGLEPVVSKRVLLQLGRVLRIPTHWLNAPFPSQPSPDAASHFVPSQESQLPCIEQLALKDIFPIYHQHLPVNAMRDNPDGFWPCPQCGAALQVRTFLREDLEGNSLTALQLDCTSCLFRLEEELPEADVP